MLSNLSPVVKNLLIINIICFIGSWTFAPSIQLLGVHYPDSPLFQVWQPITYMFMHGSIGHIFFNMFGLVMFGSIIERVLGSKRFLNYYLICGLGALMLQYLVQAVELYSITGTVLYKSSMIFDQSIGRFIPENWQSMDRKDVQTIISIYNTNMVGASGAVVGLLMAFAYLFPNMPLYFMFIPVPIKAKYFVGGYLLISIYLGFNDSGSSIAHLAHVGGALFGYILIKVWGIKKGYY